MWHEDSAGGGGSPGFDPASAPVRAAAKRVRVRRSPALRDLRRRILMALAELAATASRRSSNPLLGETERADLGSSARCVHALVGELSALKLWPRLERDGEIVLHVTAEAARELLPVRANVQVGPAIAALKQVDAAARNAFLSPRDRR